MPTANVTDPTPMASDRKMNTSPMSERMTMWPPVMLANNRTQSANGFVNSPSTSIGTMIGHSVQCTPPVRWARYDPNPMARMAAAWIMTNAMMARPAVTAMFPVAVAAYGTNP